MKSTLEEKFCKRISQNVPQIMFFSLSTHQLYETDRLTRLNTLENIRQHKYRQQLQQVEQTNIQVCLSSEILLSK